MSEMSPTQKKFMPALQMQTSSIKQKWKNAVRTGDLLTVRKLMRDFDINANQPVTVTGENPLKKLLLSDSKPDIYIHQEAVAHLLIAQGCELRVPDKFFMVPADYALLSNNREAALTVVRETIRQYRENGDRDYMPYVDAFFATRLDTETRINRHYHLTRNHAYIGANLLNSKIDRPLLSDAQKTYWERPYQRKLPDMPYYTTDFSRAMKEKQRRVEILVLATGELIKPITRPHNWNTFLSIEEAHDIGYRATVKRVLELRREI